MALNACCGRVLASQRELGGAVIERGALPCRGGVAELTILGETGRHVIGVGGGLVIL